MSSFLDKEAKGDWRNFKGDHYHLIYLVWALLHKSGSIAFYQGNDLLQIPATVGTGDAVTPLQLRSQAVDADEWIQLKSTGGVNWTCTSIFRDLFANFLFNALTSEKSGRDWKAVLVTQSPIDRVNIQSFVDGYNDSKADPNLKTLFVEVLDETARIWNSENQSQLSRSDLETLGLKVLHQISEQVPALLDIMRLQCEVKLTRLYPDERRVERILNVLSGALLEEARKGPKHAQFYDLSWLERASGESLRSSALFDQDPVAACEEANGSFLPRDWEPNYLTPRTELQTTLHEFLVASENVFCLIGSSGIGKSWTAAWVATQCQGHVPLLLAASELDSHKSVAELVASRLKVYTSVQDSEEALLNRWRASATSPRSPVLILDDLRVSSADARQLRNRIASLCDQAHQHGVKLILTCQAQIWRVNNLGSEINPADVFPLSTEQDDSILSSDTESSEDTEEITDDEQEGIFTARYKVKLRRSLKSQRVSFSLEDFNADELEDAVKRRLGNVTEARRDQISYQLRSPAFGALRNPYLLDQYINQQSEKLRGSESAPPLDVDSLLDGRVQASLARVAEGMGCDPTDLEEAFAFLVAEMWDARGRGISKTELAQKIHTRFGLDGNRLVTELRLVALLTPTSPLLLERTPLAERLFALELEKRIASGSALLEELRLEEDSGVVAAYLRHLSSCYQLPDFTANTSVLSYAADTVAVAVAEQLLHADRSWLRAVCDGLAQASPDDIRVVSFLATLTHSTREEGGIEHHACRALGRLAARGGAARRWVASMYLSGAFIERLHGAIALSEMLELDPRRLGKIVARRLGRATQIDCFKHKESDRRQAWLRHALDPLNHPRHHEAARVAKKVAASYSNLATECGPRYTDEKGNKLMRKMFDQNFDRKFAEDVAEVRGGQILWSDVECQEALNDLASEDLEKRYSAALSMRPASFSALDKIADALLERLRVEDNPVILSRLLWASNGLTRPRYAARLLAALRKGVTNQWNDRLICGPTLVLLSRLAPREAQGVFDFLPRQLDKFTEVEAMYLHEALVYAWWALAEQSKRLPLPIRELPWQHLQELSLLSDDIISGSQEEDVFEENPSPVKVDTEDGEPLQSRLRPRDGWTFQAKGAALARLALIGRNRIRAVESEMHELGGWWPYYFAELDELTAKHKIFLSEHAELPKFQEALVVAARAHVNTSLMHVHSFDGEQDTFKRMGYYAAALCLKSLAAMWADSESPVDAVEQLTRSNLGDWEQIYLVRLLLEGCNRNADLISLAQALCDELGQHQTANGGSEREKTRAVLAQIRAETDDVAAVKEYREQEASTFWGFDKGAGGLAHLADFRPERLLETLDISIKRTDDLLSLYLWQRETRDWRALLLAKVFARMFDSRPIRPTEAIQLCEWTLTALQALPESPLRQQWWTAYSSIHSVLSSDFCPGGEIEGHQTPIQSSHLQAMWLLNQSLEPEGVSREWFDAYFEPTHTLTRAATFSVNDGNVSYMLGGRGSNTLYCFPSVRLVGVALSNQRYGVDPVALRMQNRAKLDEFLEEHSHFFHDPYRLQMEQERKDLVAGAYEKLLASQKESEAPRDDEFRIQHLNVLLMSDQPDRAEEATTLYLTEAEKRLLTTKSTFWGFWYDLACAQARLGKETQARSSLLKAAEYAPLNGESLQQDSDLASIQDKEWFKELVIQFTAKDNSQGRVHYELTPPAVVTDVKVEGDKYSISIDMSRSSLRALPPDTAS